MAPPSLEFSLYFSKYSQCADIKLLTQASCLQSPGTAELPGPTLKKQSYLPMQGPPGGPLYLSRHKHSILSLLPAIAVVECWGQGTHVPSSMLSSLYVPTGQAAEGEICNHPLNI